MTENQETICTVILMGAPLTVIVWPWLPSAVIVTAAGLSLTLMLGVAAYLATHFAYGFRAGLLGRGQ